MKYSSECIVLGKELKELVDFPSGVLIFEGKDLHFIPTEDPICRFIRGVCTKQKGKRLIVSNQFDKLKELENNKKYVIYLGYLGLEVWSEDKHELITYVDGALH